MRRRRSARTASLTGCVSSRPPVLCEHPRYWRCACLSRQARPRMTAPARVRRQSAIDKHVSQPSGPLGEGSAPVLPNSHPCAAHSSTPSRRPSARHPPLHGAIARARRRERALAGRSRLVPSERPRGRGGDGRFHRKQQRAGPLGASERAAQLHGWEQRERDCCIPRMQERGGGRLRAGGRPALVRSGRAAARDSGVRVWARASAGRAT